MNADRNIFQHAGQPLDGTARTHSGRLCEYAREILAFKWQEHNLLVHEFKPFPKADVKIGFSKISTPAVAEGENEWEPKSSQ